MFDLLFIDKYSVELNDNLLNSRVDKIYQPNNMELVIKVRKPGESVNIRIDITADNTHLRLTQSVPKNPSSPPSFCMLLRKYLIGSKIIGVNNVSGERVINLLFQGRHPEGYVTEWVLSVELMGKYSNVIFYHNDTHEVLGLIKPSFSSLRELKVGGHYELPPIQAKLDLDNFNFKKLVEVTLGEEKTPIDKIILTYFPMSSPYITKEFLLRQGIEIKELDKFTDTEIQVLIDLYKTFYENLVFKPTMFQRQNGMFKDFYCMPLQSNENLLQIPYINLLSLVQDFYDKREIQNTLAQNKNKLKKVVNQNIKKLEKKQKALTKDLNDYENAERFKIYGDLLMSNLRLLKKGVTEVEVFNYYTSENENIQIDPSLTPIQNSQLYYKKYSKAKRGLSIVKDNLANVSEEIKYLDSLNHFIETDDLDDLQEIERELENQEYIKKPKVKGKVKDNKGENPSKPMEFTSKNGYKILVGRNNKQNDILTLKMAKDEDIWLHTKDIPGSHVILKDGKKAMEETIIEAAMLAAFYSKAKHSSNVAVDYTLVKNVFKPKGSKPGMVNYVEQKTVYVTPDEAAIEKLKVNN